MRIPSHLETRQQRDVGPPPSATPVSAQLRQISLSGYRCGSGPHDAQRFTRAGAGALRHPPSEGEPLHPKSEPLGVGRGCGSSHPLELTGLDRPSGKSATRTASAWLLSLPSKSTLKVCRTRANKSRSEVGCCFASSIGRPWAHSVAVTVPSSSAARVREPASGC